MRLSSLVLLSLLFLSAGVILSTSGDHEYKRQNAVVLEARCVPYNGIIKSYYFNCRVDVAGAEFGQYTFLLRTDVPYEVGDQVVLGYWSYNPQHPRIVEEP